MRAFLSGVAVALTALAASADAASSYQPLTGQVVDKKGVVIGPFIDGSVWVAAGPERLPVSVDLGPSTVQTGDGSTRRDVTRLQPIASGSGGGVFFESPGCTGAAYIVSSGALRLGTLPRFVFADENGAATVYVGSSRATPLPRHLTSILEGDAYPPQCSDDASSIGFLLVPVTEVIDLSTTFKVPYRVR